MNSSWLTFFHWDEKLVTRSELEVERAQFFQVPVEPKLLYEKPGQAQVSKKYPWAFLSSSFFLMKTAITKLKRNLDFLQKLNLPSLKPVAYILGA